LARGRAGWLWGGATGYLVLIPLVWTRRTIARMRGVRIVAALLASLTLGEVAMLLLLPPQSHRLVPLSLHWCWGLYSSGIVSLCALIVACRFGGSLPPLPRVIEANGEDAGVAGPPHGETLH
jgi:hypothetical protein